MDTFFSYQQDSVINQNRVLIPDSLNGFELRIDQTPELREMPVIRGNVTDEKIDATPVLNTPVIESVRYGNSNIGEEMLIDNSGFIEPLKKVNLDTTKSVAVKNISLPEQGINNLNTDWLTMILVLAMVLFASVKTVYSKYMGHLFQSVFNYSTAVRLFQEKSYSLLHGAYRLEIFFYLIFSIFLFQVLNYFDIGFLYSGFILYLMCLGSVVVYFYTKKLVYFLAANLFKGTQETEEYLFNMDNHNRIAGLLLFPVVALIAFSPFRTTDFQVILGVFIFATLFFLLLRRGFIILLKKQFSIFYLFLYLCSLEFLPLLLIYKIVVA